MIRPNGKTTIERASMKRGFGDKFGSSHRKRANSDRETSSDSKEAFLGCYTWRNSYSPRSRRAFIRASPWTVSHRESCFVGPHYNHRRTSGKGTSLEGNQRGQSPRPRAKFVNDAQHSWGIGLFSCSHRRVLGIRHPRRSLSGCRCGAFDRDPHRRPHTRTRDTKHRGVEATHRSLNSSFSSSC